MTNAWSLLFDMIEQEDTISFEQIEDTILFDDKDMESLNSWDLMYGIDPDNSITLTFDKDPLAINGFWKYGEDQTMKEIREYISSTYKSHYTSEESKIQTLDLIESIGDAEPFCRSNAIKYLSRFGKKDGKNRLDLLKVIHYCVLLYHFSGFNKKDSTRYETF